MEKNINPFKRPMNALQTQWYRILLARRVGIQPTPPKNVNEDKKPYQNICRKRYLTAFQRYNKQFVREIEQLEAMQPSAIDAMRIHRSFSITTFWPPLHSKHEINLTLEHLEKVLSLRERRRLEAVLQKQTLK
ncbi:uncharacterized protein LOC119687319 [Teleopsis dalmanni]|uniref:uncharacterized protein LOC119687319 n=1 Tax=Teleopsis dalmanni TaxID=139649 RepID=UPI0018CFE238|nr:uncharacterized protein LOC119687319 [Teleopsis dalmanni]